MPQFEFGANWQVFIESISEERIAAAELSLGRMLGSVSVAGKSFLDIGSGSGLFSLAAHRQGALVHSFDRDSLSVACTKRLHELYASDDSKWTVEEGSILDSDYVNSLGPFDVVYSWGVLHHTGEMWSALENAARLTKPGGHLFIALYNDQGRASKRWTFIKKVYCSLPRFLKWIVLFPCAIRLWGPTMVRDLLRLRPFQTWFRYKRERGMSPWRDVIDWVGGYPFEVSTPEQIFERLSSEGFTLTHLKTCGGGRGCNEYVFRKTT